MAGEPVNPLDYQTPTESPAGRPRRVPLVVLFAIVVLPALVFGKGCRRMMPGEVLRPSEILPRAAGCPIALVLAVASFRRTSTRRRIGLAVVMMFSIAGLAGAIADLAQYGWTQSGASPYGW